MKHAVVLLAIVLGQSAASRIGQSAEPIEIGSRRELFVDRHLIAELSGGAALTLPTPEPQEVVLTTDKPWEGNTCAYYTIFRGGNRSNYMTWGLLQLPHNDRAYSVYATEAYYAGPDSRVRRFTYRVDGFVSVHAGEQAGDIVTKPITFYGQRLTVNFATSTGGTIQIELQDVTGQPLEQLALNDCRPLQGDAVDQTVQWGKSADVGSWAGKPVCLHFRLTNANLYSFRFQE